MSAKVFAGAVAVATCVACSSGTGPKADFPATPLSATMTQSGKLRVEMRTSPQPPTQGGIDAEYIITDAASGAPRDGLTLQIRPWMPAFGHGAIMATVTPEGGGKYLLTEIDLFMAGLWQLKTTISGPVSDYVAPEFEVP
jgi:hypothetical protein